MFCTFVAHRIAAQDPDRSRNPSRITANFEPECPGAHARAGVCNLRVHGRGGHGSRFPEVAVGGGQSGAEIRENSGFSAGEPMITFCFIDAGLIRGARLGYEPRSSSWIPEFLATSSRDGWLGAHGVRGFGLRFLARGGEPPEFPAAASKAASRSVKSRYLAGLQGGSNGCAL